MIDLSKIQVSKQGDTLSLKIYYDEAFETGSRSDIPKVHLWDSAALARKILIAVQELDERAKGRQIFKKLSK
jgi:hypothetical protein